MAAAVLVVSVRLVLSAGRLANVSAHLNVMASHVARMAVAVNVVSVSRVIFALLASVSVYQSVTVCSAEMTVVAALVGFVRLVLCVMRAFAPQAHLRAAARIIVAVRLPIATDRDVSAILTALRSVTVAMMFVMNAPKHFPVSVKLSVLRVVLIPMESPSSVVMMVVAGYVAHADPVRSVMPAHASISHWLAPLFSTVSTAAARTRDVPVNALQTGIHRHRGSTINCSNALL